MQPPTNNNGKKVVRQTTMSGNGRRDEMTTLDKLNNRDNHQTPQMNEWSLIKVKWTQGPFANIP